jgi:Glycosyl transferase family 2
VASGDPADTGRRSRPETLGQSALRPPLISVAIPTCRRPAMLERAIRSVAEQTFRDWEIVVSDDERKAGS